MIAKGWPREGVKMSGVILWVQTAHYVRGMLWATVSVFFLSVTIFNMLISPMHIKLRHMYCLCLVSEENFANFLYFSLVDILVVCWILLHD